MRIRAIFAAAACFFILSCASTSKKPPEVCAPKIKLALLPLSNQSNDLDAPDVVRDLMAKQIVSRGYELVPLSETDEILKQNGISEGGQLNALTPRDLGVMLNAERLVYGDIIEYNHINVGVYRNRVVELEFKMVDPLTGAELWKNSKKVSNKDVSVDKKSIRESFIAGLAEKLIEKMVSKPLFAEAAEAVRRVAATLP